ncbi:MAG: 50S ribosomal protein L5 [bacterium]
MTDLDLKTRYYKEIAPALQKELKLKNLLAVPKLRKVVVNIGIPKSDSSTKDIEVAKKELALMTGQAPRVTLAKASIAGFKIRAGEPLGVMVTLRGQRMFDFLDKLCRIVLPQVKDFRGVKRNAFDGAGNYTLGLTEQIIFPEIDYAHVERIHGLEISIITSATSNEQGLALLLLIGMPFEKGPEETK